MWELLDVKKSLKGGLTASWIGIYLHHLLTFSGFEILERVYGNSLGVLETMLVTGDALGHTQTIRKIIFGNRIGSWRFLGLPGTILEFLGCTWLDDVLRNKFQDHPNHSRLSARESKANL